MIDPEDVDSGDGMNFLIELVTNQSVIHSLKESGLCFDWAEIVKFVTDRSLVIPIPFSGGR